VAMKDISEVHHEESSLALQEQDIKEKAYF